MIVVKKQLNFLDKIAARQNSIVNFYVITNMPLIYGTMENLTERSIGRKKRKWAGEKRGGYF